MIHHFFIQEGQRLHLSVRTVLVRLSGLFILVQNVMLNLARIGRAVEELPAFTEGRSDICVCPFSFP